MLSTIDNILQVMGGFYVFVGALAVLACVVAFNEGLVGGAIFFGLSGGLMLCFGGFLLGS